MTALFGRAYALTVGSVKVAGVPGAGLHVRFTVKRTLKPEPNTLEIDVYGLGEDTRGKFMAPGLPVQLDAGYVDGASTIYIGTTRMVQVRREGDDVITKVTAGDGEKAARSARVNTSTPAAQVQPKGIVDTAAGALKAAGLNAGNVDAMAAKLNAGLAAKLAKLGKTGIVLTGSAPKQMQAVMRSTGLEYSIQSDKIQVLERRRALDGAAIFLDAAHGLVGSPTLETKGKTQGRIKAKALMLPDAIPGRALVVKSEFISGQYRIEATTHTGDWDGTDWYVEIEGSPL